jgi:hypothetical protein
MSESDGEMNLLDELNKSFLSGKNDGGFGKYTQDVQNFGHIPENPYDHSWGLIKSRKRDLAKEGINYLDDPMIYLGNVENEKSLRFYQLDMTFLAIINKMAQTDPVMEYVYTPLDKIFKMEIRMTCNIGNAERHLQAGHVPVSSESHGSRILGKKRKRKPVEYVVPSDEEINDNMY